LEEAQQFGQVIRDFLGLGKRPADILRRVLEEDYAVKLFHAPGLAGSAASTVGSVGRAVLLNSSEPPWRRNFSLAHELFHLLTWSLVPLERLQSDAALKQRIEKLGENFASGLVLPSEEVSAAWDAKAQNGKTRYTDVIEIARVFGVSTEALIWRMVNLGRIVKKEADRVLADERFRSQDKATMAGIWGVDPPPIPERFVALGFRAWQEGELSRGRLAEFLHTNLGELGKVLAGYGLNENEDYEATLPPGRRQHRHQSPRT
jgi:Zn-dependent peptidase ImmA (M78 family)